jgi:hypothetical protein
MPAGLNITYAFAPSARIDAAQAGDWRPCPRCGALRGDPCRTPGDRITDPHTARGVTPICGEPCYYGGLSAARKYSSTDLGWMGHCNRRVKNDGDRCAQHARQACGSSRAKD